MGIMISNYRPTKKPDVSKMPGKIRTRFLRFWKLYYPVITKYERDKKVDSDAFNAALKDAKKARDLFYNLAERSQESYPKDVQEALTLAYFHMDHMTDLERFAQADDIAYRPKTCKEGDKNSTVKGYQQLLRFWDFYKKKLDGDYGRGTIAAVKKFQKKNRLKDDGTIGKKTAAKVVEYAVEQQHGSAEIRKIC